MKLTVVLSTFVLVMLFVAASAPMVCASAYPYIDPGMGSLVWQMLIAGVLGFLFLVKGYGRKVMSALGKRPGREEEAGDDDE